MSDQDSPFPGMTPLPQSEIDRRGREQQAQQALDQVPTEMLKVLSQQNSHLAEIKMLLQALLDRLNRPEG